MQHDERMADDNAYVEALERQALASEEDNARLRAEIAAVCTPGPSLSVDPTTQADTRAKWTPADRSRAGSTAPASRRGPSESRFEGQSGAVVSFLSSDSRVHTPFELQRLRDVEYTVAHLEATLSVMETGAFACSRPSSSLSFLTLAPLPAHTQVQISTECRTATSVWPRQKR